MNKYSAAASGAAWKKAEGPGIRSPAFLADVSAKTDERIHSARAPVVLKAANRSHLLFFKERRLQIFFFESFS
jgi:hypothetical protein